MIFLECIATHCDGNLWFTAAACVWETHTHTRTLKHHLKPAFLMNSKCEAQYKHAHQHFGGYEVIKQSAHTGRYHVFMCGSS